MQFLGKLMSETWKNEKKPNFWWDFDKFSQNLGPHFLCVSVTSTSNKTLFKAIILCNLKED